MASHVVVIDASMKRITVKTTPSKHLSDVLAEACTKLGLKPENYALKHDNKQVDLSRTIRLSGLTSGARLMLVQASRSPSVVSVALQLPTAGDSSGSLARLTDKFPSNTSIWQILRRFEAGAAGTASSPSRNLNFTQRATPLVTGGRGSGGGRLCYEMPVINVMGRDLASFVDLQKTLAQIGFNSGSCLLRLSFRNTEQPLEEAMAEISQYFQDAEEPPASSQPISASPPPPPPAQPTPPATSSTAAESLSPSKATSASDDTPTPAAADAAVPPADSQPTAQTPSQISIFAPPSSSTPAAATQTAHNEADYVPSVAHAQLHQARLANDSRNKRLQSDAELNAQEQSRAAALSSIKEVTVRFRFPDQSQAQRTFDQTATTADLYSMCREVMDRPAGEPFTVRTVGTKASTDTLPDASGSGKRLIRDMGWQGRVLLTVVWGDGVPADRRRKPVLKSEYRQKAEALKVSLSTTSGTEAEESAQPVSSDAQNKSRSDSGAKQDKESKLKGLLKGLSRK